MKKRARLDKHSAAELIAIAETTRDALLAPTVAIYQGQNHGVPEIVGSGVLVTLAGLRFLLTAGHVLDRHKEGELVVGLSPELLSIAGDPTRLRTPGSKEGSADRIDIGVIQLRGGPWDDIPFDRFLGWEQLDAEIPIIARHSYALVGYPNSMNRAPVTGAELKPARSAWRALSAKQSRMKQRRRTRSQA